MYKVEKYFRAKSINEATSLLKEVEGSKLIAGGTDFIPGYHHSSKRFNFEKLIDISQIDELKTITEGNSIISIGACSTFSSILSSKLISTELPILVEAVSKIGSVQIRNRATIGGNICNNAPCADSVPALLVYDAEIELFSSEGKIILPIRDFLTGAYGTTILSDQIVTRIMIDKAKLDYQSGFFYKLGRRRAVAVSRLTFAFLYKKQKGILEKFAFAAGAVTPTGKRFTEVEKEFQNMKIDDGSIKILTKAIVDKALEYSGLRWSSLYKIPVLTENVYFYLRNHLIE